MYDAIVLGLGGVGSAALLSLARRGARVLGLDAHPPVHAFGSSHGHTRVFRHAYFEHPDYVPLLRASTAAFEGWERAAGVDLLHRCGVLLVGRSDSVLVGRSAEAAAEHGVPVEPLDAARLRGRFPQFTVAEDTIGLFEPGGGFVRVERAVSAALGLADEAGAERRHGARVVDWRVRNGGVEVVVANGERLRARRLVVAAGPWTPVVCPMLAPHLTVTRLVQVWLEPSAVGSAHARRFPCWLVDRPGRRAIYGIPVDPERPGCRHTKVAVHHSDTVVAADTVDRSIHRADTKVIQDAVNENVPGIFGPVAAAAVCMYTNTADEDFIVDHLPGLPQVVVATGLSGHGFKLAPALGDALTDLALDGGTALPIGFLRLARLLGPSQQ